MHGGSSGGVLVCAALLLIDATVCLEKGRRQEGDELLFLAGFSFCNLAPLIFLREEGRGRRRSSSMSVIRLGTYTVMCVLLPLCGKIAVAGGNRRTCLVCVPM
ncbi:hypothetical protein GUJ93_ZPchr0003g17648 [Zizania palustris]|uniref:Secreted peptide n=1 Tax=Zizania palustris TaxID=103762 RepID=A0A8J5VIT3_ZIZPA|nr:hypothetical protein GUJ93_ZPchr0003g17648 [Zizania palustris]